MNTIIIILLHYDYIYTIKIHKLKSIIHINKLCLILVLTKNWHILRVKRTSGQQIMPIHSFLYKTKY